MLCTESVVNVCDNSGVKKACIIGINSSTGQSVATIGSVVILSAKSVIPNSNVKKGSKVYGVIVRTRKKFSKEDGSFVSFSDNAVVLLSGKDSTEPLGTRVFGPIANIGSSFQKIISLASEVV